MTNPDTLDQVIAGDQRTIARLATRIVNGLEGAETMDALHSRAGTAHVIGVTGPPGAGKSTLLAGLATELSKRGKRVAIIAIDPSSPKTGGAALGDRIRMSEAALDPKVFVRSLAARNSGDGLAPAAADLAVLFDAAGFDYVAIESVGAGQDQVDIAELVHTTVLVQIPGAGDSVQLLKAGAMEIADVYVVNKTDLPGAQRVARDLRTMLSLADQDADAWTPPIVMTSHGDTTGYEWLADAIDQRYDYLKSRQLLEERQRRIARSELKRALVRRVQLGDDMQTNELVARLAERSITPDQAATIYLRSLVDDEAPR